MVRGVWEKPGPSAAKPGGPTWPLCSWRRPGLGAPLLEPDSEVRPESLGCTSTKTCVRRSPLGRLPVAPPRRRAELGAEGGLEAAAEVLVEVAVDDGVGAAVEEGQPVG